ncbi:hypothetical protein D3C79_878390 [compost metagenome]
MLRRLNLGVGRRQVALPGVQRYIGTGGAAAADVHALPAGTQVARSEVLALRGQFAAGTQRQFAVAAQFAVLLHACRQGAAFAAVQAGSLNLYIVARSDRTAVLHFTLAGDACIARSEQ